MSAAAFSGVGNNAGVAKWEPAAQAAWQELLQNDRARDVEACSKSLIRLCFLLASRETERARYDGAKKIVKIGNKAKGDKQESPESLLPTSHDDKRTTLQTIEQLLRHSGARLRLVACKRRPDQNEEIVFRYPGRDKPMKNTFYLCIEGPKAARQQAKLSGWQDTEESDEALSDAGFVVYQPASAQHSSTLDTLNSLPDHVQLAHDSPLLPQNVPKTWLPAHCCTCRRLPSQPTTLYKLPCPGCETMYCCSANCWSEHLAHAHNQKEKSKEAKAGTTVNLSNEEPEVENDEAEEEEDDGEGLEEDDAEREDEGEGLEEADAEE